MACLYNHHDTLPGWVTWVLTAKLIKRPMRHMAHSMGDWMGQNFIEWDYGTWRVQFKNPDYYMSKNICLCKYSFSCIKIQGGYHFITGGESLWNIHPGLKISWGWIFNPTPAPPVAILPKFKLLALTAKSLQLLGAIWITDSSDFTHVMTCDEICLALFLLVVRLSSNSTCRRWLERKI